MDQGPLAQEIIEAFGTMSPQLQKAARYILDCSSDVALLSMREQARRAGVNPATMTRLAKHLGRDGYERIRESYAAAVRSGGFGFAGKVDSQVVSQKLKGEKALVAEILSSAGQQIAAVASERELEDIVAMARRLQQARRVYSLGLRSGHAVAWHFHYILSLIGDRSILLDGIAGTGPDALKSATPDDVLLAVSVMPYTRQTIVLARHAADRGLSVLAITDSKVAPLAHVAESAIIVPTDGPSFFHSMAPAFAVAEALGALMAGQEGELALRSMRDTERYFADLNIHLKTRSGTRPS